MDFIDEMIKDIKNHQNTLDMPVFLNFLKEELDKAGIELTIIRSQMPPVMGTCILASDIMGIRLDLSKHDKKKDAEIEKCKAVLDFSKQELNKTISKYRNENGKLQYEVKKLKESQEEVPIEPIKIAEWLIGRRSDSIPIYSTSGLREIAEYLNVYCNHNTRE